MNFNILQGERKSYDTTTIKKLLFATKLFQRLKQIIGKTNFFDSYKSLPTEITHQILKHLQSKNNYWCYNTNFICHNTNNIYVLWQIKFSNHFSGHF